MKLVLVPGKAGFCRKAAVNFEEYHNRVGKVPVKPKTKERKDV